MNKDQNPLSQIRHDGGMMNIFRRIGCIGDSLSSGEFEYDNNGEKGYWDCYEYSWGKQIERITGIEMTNFSRGGLTAFQLYKDADEKTSPVEEINHLFDKRNIKQGYIIALGVNDMKGKDVLKNVYGGQVGDPGTDIDLKDYHNNAPSFVGWYAKVIQRLQELEPEAKFFLVTMPDDDGNEGPFAKVINNIAGKLKNCYVIDLHKYAPSYDKEFHDRYFCGGHMNAMGYLISAYYIMTYIDWIIRNHMDDFKLVQFIGTGCRPYTEK